MEENDVGEEQDIMEQGVLFVPMEREEVRHLSQDIPEQ
jgi:hypothetical protein